MMIRLWKSQWRVAVIVEMGVVVIYNGDCGGNGNEDAKMTVTTV
jgi:hypothetical protein